MVSKAAVMALVAILAVPILLGYGMNLTNVTETEYEPDGESVNVTPLLETGTAYTTANAEITSLNTDFEYSGTPYVPVYTTAGTTYTSVQWYQEEITLAPGGSVYWRPAETDNEIYVFVGGHPSNLDFYRLGPTGWDDLKSTKTNIETVHYFAAEGIVQMTYYGGASYYTISDTQEFLMFYNNSVYDVTLYYYNRSTTGTSYVNIADGYRFVNQSDYVQLNTPEKTKSILMTVDLNTATDSTYYFSFSAGNARIQLVKTTTNGVVNWSVVKGFSADNPVTVIDSLYYDPNRSSNTYQIYLGQELIGSYQTEPIPALNIPSYTYYTIQMNIECRYVGDWPTIIGSANYYQKYEYSWTRDLQSTYDTFDRVKFYSLPITSPKLRIDGALYSAFEYSIIADTTYTPSDFKTNPTTVLSVQNSGTSFEFGGNTYVVDSNGNISLGTHKVSTNGLKLESVPVAVGYENKINGYTISVTAQPSTIRFNGYWAASVSTYGNAATTVTKTEWTPGQFGWDGVDSNFLIAGLLTSMVAFIALGIYIRRTKSSLWPLLLVCGGAAMLFLFML